MTENNPSREIWLALVGAEEFLTIKDIRSKLTGVYLANVYATVKDMVSVGTLSKRQDGIGMLRYGVTSSCRIPRGITMGEISRAMEAGAE